MAKLIEHRCPICSALYNVEQCNQSIHSGHNARLHERKACVAFVRDWGRHCGDTSMDHALNRLADELEAYVIPADIGAPRATIVEILNDSPLAMRRSTRKL